MTVKTKDREHPDDAVESTGARVRRDPAPRVPRGYRRRWKATRRNDRGRRGPRARGGPIQGTLAGCEAGTLGALIVGASQTDEETVCAHRDTARGAGTRQSIVIGDMRLGVWVDADKVVRVRARDHEDMVRAMRAGRSARAALGACDRIAAAPALDVSGLIPIDDHLDLVDDDDASVIERVRELAKTAVRCSEE